MLNLQETIILRGLLNLSFHSLIVGCPIVRHLCRTHPWFLIFVIVSNLLVADVGMSGKACFGLVVFSFQQPYACAALSLSFGFDLDLAFGF